MACIDCGSTQLPEITNTETSVLTNQGVNFLGTYDSTYQYSKNDIVYSQGSSFIATSIPTIGTDPITISTINPPWMYFAKGGTQGPQGQNGPKGGISFNFLFSTANTSSDPGTGYLKFDNAGTALTTHIYISKSDTSGGNLTTLYGVLPTNFLMQVYSTQNNNIYSLYAVTAVSGHTSWFTFTATYLGGTLLTPNPLTFINNQNILVSFGTGVTLS